MLAAGGAAQTQSRRRLPAQLEAACRLGSNLNGPGPGQVSGEALKLEKKLTSTTSLRRLLGSGRSDSDAGRWRPASEPEPVTVPVRVGPESACSQPEPRLQVRHTLARFDSESRSLDSESQARRLESESAESSHTVVVHALRLAKLQTPPA